jgi:hypothetical protein
MRLAWYMAKLAKGGFSCSVFAEMQQLVQKPHDEVRDEKK